jgi:hypothetical protein
LESIIPIKGNVQHQITLDPTVWIFDDRRIDLETFFTADYVEKDEIEEYKRDMGAHWSREIMEGATFPPTLKSEKKYEKTRMLTGTFGMLLNHFVQNAKPAQDARTLILETSDGQEHAFPIAQADELVLKFSEKGKPILENGPVYVLFKDGSNLNDPIRNVNAIRID